VTSTTKTANATFGPATASCTGTKVLYGGGAIITQGTGGGPGTTGILQSGPSSATVWTATAIIHVSPNGGSAFPIITAYAICGNP
jgi:hypothetical protein